MTDETQPPDLTGLPKALVPLVTAMLAHAPGDRPVLAEVTDRCVALMKDAGFTPVEARYALIDIAVPFGGGDGRTGPSPSVWERIAVQYGDAPDVHTQIVDEDGVDSPLDRPSRPDGAEDGAEPEPPVRQRRTRPTPSPRSSRPATVRIVGTPPPVLPSGRPSSRPAGPVGNPHRRRWPRN